MQIYLKVSLLHFSESYFQIGMHRGALIKKNKKSDDYTKKSLLVVMDLYHFDNFEIVA